MAEYLLDAKGNGQIFAVQKTICKESSAWQTIEISELELLGRVLALDGIIQLSELDKDRYHETITHPVLQASLRTPNSSAEILILGGGDGIIASEVIKYAGVGVTIVDIDARVVELCAEHLSDLNNNALTSKSTKVLTMDALEFTSTAPRERYDAIFLDITDPHPESPSSSLLSSKAIRDYKSLLTPGGVIVCQTDNPFVTSHHRQQMRKLFGDTFSTIGEFGITALTFAGVFSFVWASDYHQELVFDESMITTKWLTAERFEFCKKMLNLA